MRKRGPFGLPIPKLSVKAKRLQELERAKADASNNYPGLIKWLDDLADDVRKTGSGSRVKYYDVLGRIYAQVIDWDGDDLLDEFASTIASLQSKRRRKNLSAINEIVGAICARADRNRQLVSRWSHDLNKALDDGVSPADLKQFLLAG